MKTENDIRHILCKAAKFLDLFLPLPAISHLLAERKNKGLITGTDSSVWLSTSKIAGAE